MKTEPASREVSLCERLEWDSNFFGRSIGRVREGRLSSAAMGQILEWCAAEGIQCLYLLAACDDLQTVLAAEEHGFHFADIRITLERSLDSISVAKSGNVRLAQASDMEFLKQTARSSFRDSRFYYDPKFDKSRCDELYPIWVEKSCNSETDFVVVAEEAGRPAGWLACHTGPGETGRMGLMAVDVAHQGRGLGRQLVTNALHTLRERGMRTADIVTQGRNIRSQRLFQKCGFATQSVQLWYHRWFV